MGVFDVESEYAAAQADRAESKGLAGRVSEDVRNSSVPWEQAPVAGAAVASGGLTGITLPDIPKSFYQWAVQAWHDVDQAKAEMQLYTRPPVGTVIPTIDNRTTAKLSEVTGVAEANALTYFEGALFGINTWYYKFADDTADDPPREQYYNKTFGEWATSVVADVVLAIQNISREIYRWSIQAIHMVPSSSANAQLYQRDGDTARDLAAHPPTPITYMTGAIWGVKDDDSTPPKRIPKNIGEWAESVVNAVSRAAWNRVENLDKGLYKFLFGGDGDTTFSSAVSDVFDDLRQLGADAAHDVLDVFKTGGDDAREWFEDQADNIGSALGELGESVWSNLTNLGKGVYEFLFGDGNDSLGAVAKSAFNKLREMTLDAATDVVDVFTDAATKAQAWFTDNAAKLGTAIGSLGEATWTAMDGLDKAIYKFMLGGDGSTNFTSAVWNTFNKIKDVTAAGAQTLVNVIGTATKTTAVWIKDRLTNATAATWKGLNKLGQGIYKFVFGTDLTGDFPATVQNTFNKVREIAAAGAQTLVNVIGNTTKTAVVWAGETVKKVTKAVWDTAEDLGKSVYKFMLGADYASNTVLAAAQNTFNKVREIAAGGAQTLVNVIGTTQRTVAEWFSHQSGAIGTALGDAWTWIDDTMITPLRTTVSNIATFFVKLINNIASGTAVTTAATAVTNIPQILLKGIFNSNIASTVIGGYQGAIKWLTETLHAWFNGRDTQGSSEPEGQQTATNNAISSSLDVYKALTYGLTGVVGAAIGQFGAWMSSQITTTGTAIYNALNTWLTGEGGGGTTNLQAIADRLQWNTGLTGTKVPNDSNRNAIGFDTNGTFIISLLSRDDVVAIAGGSPTWHRLLVLGDSRVQGGHPADATIRLNDGVKINKKLKFEDGVNTVPGNGDRGIGYSETGDAFVKTPEGYNGLHYQAGGRTSLTVNPYGLRLADVGTSSDVHPAVNGELRRVGDNILAYSGGALRNLSSLSAALPVNRGVHLPIHMWDGSGSLTGETLDAAIGSYEGAFGLLSHTDGSSTDTASHRLCIKADDGNWYLISSNTRIGAAGAGATVVGLGQRRIRVQSGTGLEPQYPDAGLPWKVPMFYRKEITPQSTGISNRLVVGRIERTYDTTETPPEVDVQGEYVRTTNNGVKQADGTSTGAAGLIVDILPLAVSTSATPTASNADATFGAFDGTIGMYRTGSSSNPTYKLYARMGASWWVFNMTRRSYTS